MRQGLIKPHLRALLLTTALALCLPQAARAQSLWIGPAGTGNGGNWNAAANWSPNGVPNAVGAEVVLNSPLTGSSLINLQSGTFTIGTLRVQSATDYRLNTGTLRFEVASGNALIDIARSGLTARFFDNGLTLSLVSNTELRVAAGERVGFGPFATTSGAGALILSGPGTVTTAGNLTHTGGTFINAGRLQIGEGGSVGTLAGSTNVAADGTLVFNRSNTYVHAGVISGDGVVRKLGAGTTILTGDHTYTGGTVVEAGLLRVGNGGTTGSIVGDVSIAAGAGLSINRSSTIQLDGVISGAGGFTTIGTGTTVLTGNSVHTGGTAIAPGARLQLGNGGTTGSILGPVSNSGTLVFNRSNTYAFGGVIAGAGAVEQVGSGTTILSAAHNYAGATSVLGGALIVNGSIASSSGLTVAPGALVGGVGTLPGSVINGTLSPGNSVGTITVAGNLAFGAGSTYLVEILGATADRTNVTGTATLAGTLQLLALAGPYSFNAPYTVLNALGGVTGQFATVSTGNFGAGVTTSVTYDPNNVFVTLTPAPLAEVIEEERRLQLAGLITGAGANAYGVALAIDRAVAAGGNANPFFPIYNLPLGSITAAVNQLSGEVHTAGIGLGVRVSEQFLRVMLDPYALGRAPGANPARAYAGDALAGLPGVVAATQAADLASGVEVIDTRRFAVWAAAFGSDGHIDGDDGAGSARRSERTSGIAAGVDWRIAPGTLVGFALSGGGADASLSNGLGSASAEVFQAGLYGMTRVMGIDLSAALAYSRLEVDTTRAIPVLGLSAVNGSYDVDVWSGRIEASAPVFAFAGLSVAPLAAFQIQSVDTGSFVETVPGLGSPAAALAVDGRTSTTSRGELGARFEGRFAFGGIGANAFVRLAWAHYFERETSLSAALIGLPGSSFTVIGARPDRDTALISTGLDLRLTPNLSLGARFDGEFSENMSQYAGTARIRYEF